MSWIITGSQKNKGLLDEFTGAAAAYSLRNLSLLSDPAVVRVRRDNDNAEQDFTAAEVSDGTLAAWVGAGNNGFVRTWYDQSGNGRNATQATTGNQPQVVSSGSLLTDNSKPCVQFNGSSTSLDANALASVFSGTGVFLSAATVYKTLQASPASIVSAWSFGSSSTQNPLRWLGQEASSPAVRFDERDDASTGIALNVTGGIVTSQALAWINSNTTTQTLRVNGSQVGSATGANGTITLNQFSIGCLFRATKNNFWSGTIQEIILYGSNQTSNATAIEANINTHYSIYP